MVENSSTNYRDLLAQRAALEEKIKAAREEEVAGVLEQIRQLVDDYGLHDEVRFTHARGQRGRSGPRGPVAAKYRDPATGQTWSGRGRPPAWIKGKDETQFLIA
ncbi:H-NS histone family protein [Paraburkholderia sediminicola]|uniref:H-NS histone family protein n=1 Tax=Paraburkholderia sediminicola TaxID=458836 RepID=UPI0038BD14C2